MRVSKLLIPSLLRRLRSLLSIHFPKTIFDSFFTVILINLSLALNPDYNRLSLVFLRSYLVMCNVHHASVDDTLDAS